MAPDSIPHLRRALTEARQLRGWSQHELADLIGTTQINISRFRVGTGASCAGERRRNARARREGPGQLHAGRS